MSDVTDDQTWWLETALGNLIKYPQVAEVTLCKVKALVNQGYRFIKSGEPVEFSKAEIAELEKLHKEALSKTASRRMTDE